MNRYDIARGEKPVTKKEIKIIANAFWDRDLNRKLGGLSDMELSEKAMSVGFYKESEEIKWHQDST